MSRLSCLLEIFSRHLSLVIKCPFFFFFFFLYFIFVRNKYNNEYWALNGQKYLEQRSKDNKLKLKHREYNNNIYSERPKHIHQNNYYNPTLKKDFVVSFPSYDST